MPERKAETRIGRYILDERLAIGGMAELFLGRLEGPAGFQKQVVIKRILWYRRLSPGFRAMFLDEARLAARFDHPNLVQIYELLDEDEELALVMEYIEGTDLSTLLSACYKSNRQIPARIVAAVLLEAAEGLHYAHELRDESGRPLGIVHRDFTPANLIVTRHGRVKVVDFGVAKSSKSFHVTRTGTIKGKLGYLAPEQVTEAPLGPSCDLFSMGTVLYELLTGRRCFTGPETVAMLEVISSARRIPLKKMRPDTPKQLLDLEARMHAIDPRHRPQRASEVAEDLRSYLQAVGAPRRDEIAEFVFDAVKERDDGVRRGFTAIGTDEIIPVSAELTRPSVQLDEATHARFLADAVPREGVDSIE